MRLIVILLALAVLGWLVATRLQKEPESSAPAQTGEGPPAVPDRPDEVPQFEQDMNRFMEQQGEKRRRQVESRGG